MNAPKNSRKNILDLDMRLRVAYNHDRGMIEQLGDYKQYVQSVYIVPNFNVFPNSGAVLLKKINWDRYDEEAGWVIRELKKSEIKTYLLLNATNFDPDIVRGYEISELRKYLRKMVKEYGLEKAVIFSIPLAQRIKEDLPELGLEVSTNAGVDSLEKARYWQDAVDIEGICVHQRLNKRIEILKQIKTYTGLKLSAIVNSFCLVECPNEISHNNFCSYKGHSSPAYDCGSVIIEKPWYVFHQAKIVPANLEHYKGIIDIVKLEGRSADTKVLMREVKHFSENLESYNYCLPDEQLVSSYPFYHPYNVNEEPAEVFEKVNLCDRNCIDCNFCRKMWESFYKPGEHIDYYLNGCMYFRKKQYGLALDCFEKYTSLHGQIDELLLFRKAVCYKELGEFVRAMELLKRLSSGRYLLIPDVRINLGQCYLAMGEYAEAVKELETAQTQEGSSVNILVHLGIGYEGLGKFEEGLKRLQSAREINESGDWLWEINFYEGLCYMGLGNAHQAEERFLESIKIDGSRWNSYNMLGKIYYEEKRYEESEEVLLKAIRHGNSEWSNYNMLGAVYRSKGDSKKAEEFLKEAIRLKPGEWSNYNILGNIYSASGRRKEAEEMYDRALKNNPPANYSGILSRRTGKTL